MSLKSSFDKLLEKEPGLPLVAAIAASVLAVALKQTDDKLGLGTLLRVYVVSYLLYRMGGLLDDRLFTPLYGTDADRAQLGRLWRHGTPAVLAPLRWLVDSLPPTKRLEAARTTASRCLASTTPDGLYKSAKLIFGGSEEWRDHVKPVLDVSKAARTLVFPFLILAMLALGATSRAPSFWPGPHSPILVRVLTDPRVAVALLAAATFGFVYFRVWHMVALYELITSENTVFLSVEELKFNPDTGKRESARAHVLLSSRGRLVDAEQLPILDTDGTLPNMRLHPPAASRCGGEFETVLSGRRG